MGRHRKFDTDDALSSAVNVFWKRGYTDASVQDLCNAMSINPGSLYAAFGTKQDIFRSAMKHLRRTSIDWQVAETYFRADVKWRLFWRAVDAIGQAHRFVTCSGFH